MTAEYEVEALRKPARKRRRFRRRSLVSEIISAGLIGTMAWTPFGLAHQWVGAAAIPRLMAQAEAATFDEAANAGQKFGDRAVQQAPMPQKRGSRFRFPGAGGSKESLSTEQIYPDTKNQDETVADYKGLAGHDAAMEQAASGAASEIQGEDSSYAAAYRTIRQSAQSHDKPDLSNDPLFNKTDQVLETTTPDQKRCFFSPSAPPASCRLRHKVTIKEKRATVSVARADGDAFVFEFDLKAGQALQPTGAAAVETQTHVPKTLACRHAKAVTDLQTPRVGSWRGASGKIPGDPSFETELLQAPTCKNNLIGRVRITDPQGDAAPLTAKWTFRYGHITDQKWASNGFGTGASNTCLDSAKLAQNGQCGGAVSITAGQPAQAKGCTVFDGFRFCRDDPQAQYLSPPPGDLSKLGRLTRRAAITADCNFPDNCAQYKGQSRCNPVRQACKGHGAAAGPTGTCYSWRRIYQCVDPDRRKLFGTGGVFSGCRTTRQVNVGTETTQVSEERTCTRLRRAQQTECQVTHDRGNPIIKDFPVTVHLAYRIEDDTTCSLAVELGTGEHRWLDGNGCSQLHAAVDGFDRARSWLNRNRARIGDTIALQTVQTKSASVWMHPEDRGWSNVPPMDQLKPNSAHPDGVATGDPFNPVIELTVHDGTGNDDNGRGSINTYEVFYTDAKAVRDKWQWSSEACKATVDQITDGYGEGAIECQGRPKTAAADGESVVVSGTALREDRGWFRQHYSSPIPGISRYCGVVAVDPEEGSFTRPTYGSATTSCTITHNLASDTWDATEQCQDKAEMVLTDECQGTIATQRETRGDCLDVGGQTYCRKDFAAPPVAGLDPLGSHFTVISRCQGGSPQDKEDSCKALENDPECGFVNEQCVERGQSGACYRFRRTYRCTEPKAVLGDVSASAKVDCPGPVRCMGEDCVTVNRETNNQFGEAATKLKAVQWMKKNADCTQSGRCRVFKGEAMECKIAVGGLQNCCDQPTSTDLGDYLEMGYQASYLASTQTLLKDTGFGFTNPTYGAWKAASNATSAGWQATQSAFSNAWESLAGTTSKKAAKQAGGQGASGLLASAQSALMKGTAKFVGKTFGETAMNTLFQNGSKGTTKLTMSAVQSSSTKVVFSPALQMVGSIVSAAMWAYSAYQITMLAIQVAFSCTRESYQLAAKKKLEAEHKVGEYCATDSPAGCIEKRKAYCTYDSPLARIVQEQARPQLPWGWGSPESPRCRGITPQQLSNLDWSRIDLAEWQGILLEEERIPSGPGEVTEFSTTGYESTLSETAKRGYRPSVGERALDKTRDAAISETRERNRQQAWGNGP